MMLALAERNRVELRYPDVDAARAAYVFEDLWSFLDVYYAGCAVLITEQDFYDLTYAYLERACADGVRHTEMFFDPQTHTDRGIPYSVVFDGITRALEDGRKRLGITSHLILAILRHLDAASAMRTLDAAFAHGGELVAIGLDSGERGNPPEKFVDVFARARAEGLRAVAHAGEEGPPAYITGALDALHVERIDHGVRCLEDDMLVDRLVREAVPLTVCPLSNVRLRVVDTIEDHPFRVLLERGLMVTINSDDPAYFGGYVAENYRACVDALGLTDAQVLEVARNTFRASFLDDVTRTRYLDELDAFAI
jgi:adenosine deaminase